MTRAFLLAAMLGVAAGCATMNVRGPGTGSRLPEVPVGASAATSSAFAAPADSAWLTFHAPRFGSWDCAPDTSVPRRGASWCEVWKLNETTPHNYRRGCEANIACWDSVRAWNEPDTVFSAWAAPGQRCSVRVASGQYTATVRGQRCPIWRVVRVP